MNLEQKTEACYHCLNSYSVGFGEGVSHCAVNRQQMKLHSRICSVIWQEHPGNIRGISEVYTEFIRSITEVLSKYCRSIIEVYMEYILSMYGLYMKYIWSNRSFLFGGFIFFPASFQGWILLFFHRFAACNLRKNRDKVRLNKENKFDKERRGSKGYLVIGQQAKCMAHGAEWRKKKLADLCWEGIWLLVISQ